MLDIKVLDFTELTKEEQDEQPNNGRGKENASYLLVDDYQTIAIYSDAMEPEDCSFHRDLSWIRKAMLEAYELGRKDADSESPSTSFIDEDLS